MATYKVIQDIEAEDKLIGPLSAVQFIFACATAGFLYLSYIVYVKHASFLLIVFLPISLFTGFFAFPWGRDQPTEVWALAKLKFLLYPHVRVWNKSGNINLVTITAPKKVSINYTKGLTQEEVQGRLKALAETIDTRGWATKNVNVNIADVSTAVMPVVQSNDRLSAGSMVAEQETEVKANDDVLDEKNNPTAFKLTEKIQESARKHKQELIDSLAKKEKQDNKDQTKWFSGNQHSSVASAPKIEKSYYTPEQEKAISEDLHKKHERLESEYNSNIKVIKPLSEQKKEQEEAQKALANKMTHPIDPAIISMANSNDLTVATIQHEANKQGHLDSGDEVVINLH
jgi:PrgI family protein